MNAASAESLWKYFRSKLKSQEATAKLRNEIAVQNLNLVRKVAHRMEGQCAVAYEDLEQIGYFGLNKAIERFDPTKGIAFSSFAVPYIRGAILHHLRDHGSTVKIPRRWREFNAEAGRVERAWANRTGRLPNERELAEEMGCQVATLQQVRGAIANQSPISLASQQNDFDFEERLEDQTHSFDCEQSSKLEAAWKQLKANLALLSEGDRQLVNAVYFERTPRKLLARELHVEGAALKTQLQTALNHLVG